MWRKLLLFLGKLWGYVSFFVRRQVKEIVQHQTVKYPVPSFSYVHRMNSAKRKFLVLDLDETLIHSHHEGVRPLYPVNAIKSPPDLALKVVIERHPVVFFIRKRPHVDFFLSVVSEWYELVVFTASMEIYGSAVADALDTDKKVLKRRFFRQHCTLDHGSYIKDLTLVTNDLSSVFIIDNSPGAYREFPDNAIPILSWYNNPLDEALLNLLPMLDALRFVTDVRSVLSRNLHLINRECIS